MVSIYAVAKPAVLTEIFVHAFGVSVEFIRQEAVHV